MARVTLYKDICYYTLLKWLSYRDLDDPEAKYVFLQFVKLVAKYRANKWLDFEFFSSRVLKRRMIEQNAISRLHNQLQDYVKFYRLNVPKTTQHEAGEGYFQRGVRRGVRYQAEITQKEFMNGRASKQSLAAAVDLPDAPGI